MTGSFVGLLLFFFNRRVRIPNVSLLFAFAGRLRWNKQRSGVLIARLLQSTVMLQRKPATVLGIQGIQQRPRVVSKVTLKTPFPDTQSSPLSVSWCCTCCKSVGSSTLESGQQGPSSALPFVPCSTQRMLKSSSNFLWLNLLLLAMLPTWAIWRKGFTSLKAILVLHNLLLFVQTEQVIQARDFMSQLTSTGAQVGNASLCAIQAVPPGTASKAGDERAAPPRLSSTCTAAC